MQELRDERSSAAEKWELWFRLGGRLGVYVGQREANAERAMALLDALGTTVVVFLDEPEKA